MAKNGTVLDDKLHWYKDAIIYELHIKAFRDSNGDGVGDFGGLMEKLDYLQELGVTAIWVLPFYPSPLKDDGYDIADYYSINPSYGTIEQFQQFLQEAHNRKLKVITELVINHTSDQHPWFQRARKAPKGSPERDFYVWTDNPNQYKDVRIIFQDFETSNWTWDPVAHQYYWHRFFHHQPDLNYDNPLVQEEIFKILDYWCAMGVDGFRLDAVPYLFEREGTNGENLPETHHFLKKLRKHIDEKFPGTVFLAEANMWPEDSASYFGNGDECHMNYHFPVMPRMFMALQMEDRYPITDIFDQTPEIPETCQWAMFLRNHDELTLEMVTDEERDYMYKVYAKDPKAKINLGIRHRLAPLMENNRRKIELMNSLLFSLPGTPVIYYGDEIGMGDNVYLGDRDGVRTPMQWTPDRNAGFSEANPHRLYLPTILDPEYHFESVNVEMQRRNTTSLFWYMKHIINMRKKYKAFSRGDMKFINVDNPKVLVFTRTYGDETLLVLANLSKFSQPVEVNLPDFKGYQPIEVFSKNKFPSIKDGVPYFFTMAPNAYQWFVLEKVHPDADEQHLPVLRMHQWDDLLQEGGREELENKVLPYYLVNSKWFTGRNRKIYNISIADAATIPVSSYNVFFLLIDVNYESGLPETYHLPVTFVTSELGKSIGDNCPQAVLAQAQVGEQEGIICDALFTPELQQLFLTKMASDSKLKLNGNKIVFYGNDVLRQQVQAVEEIKPKIHSGDQAHTAINYNNAFFLRLYRRVEPAVNPDVEVTHYLTEEAGFEHTPGFVGAIEWRQERGTIVLGMMQIMVENHGDGYHYMLERLNNYIERILARDRSALHPEERLGTLAEPVAFDELPDELKVLLGSPAAEQSKLIGTRTAELHLSLARGDQFRDFRAEEFSLHYQRSLFSALQSLVRESYQGIGRNVKKLPEELRPEVEELLSHRGEMLNLLKRIYTKKLDVIKTRVHGNYHLGQVLLTGKDIVINNFTGNPLRSYSERRLKRSPLRDVTAMVRSFYYTAFEGFFTTGQVGKEDIAALLPFAEMWAHYMSGFFMHAYLETIGDSPIVPKEKDDLKVMLQTYLLEKAIRDLSAEVSNRPQWTIVPLRIIQAVTKSEEVL